MYNLITLMHLLITLITDQKLGQADLVYWVYRWYAATASEVTTLWRDRNGYIIVIIIITSVSLPMGCLFPVANDHILQTARHAMFQNKQWLPKPLLSKCKQQPQKV